MNDFKHTSRAIPNTSKASDTNASPRIAGQTIPRKNMPFKFSLSSEDTLALVKRVEKGDESAKLEFFNHFEPLADVLSRKAYRLGKDIVEDLAQECKIKLIQAIDKLNSGKLSTGFADQQVNSFLFKSARNARTKFFSELFEENPQMAKFTEGFEGYLEDHASDFVSEFHAFEPENSLLHDSDSHEERMSDPDTACFVQRAKERITGRMNETERQVFELHLSGLSNTEIKDKLDISRQMVSTYLKYAQRCFRSARAVETKRKLRECAKPPVELPAIKPSKKPLAPFALKPSDALPKQKTMPIFIYSTKKDPGDIAREAAEQDNAKREKAKRKEAKREKGNAKTPAAKRKPNAKSKQSEIHGFQEELALNLAKLGVPTEILIPSKDGSARLTSVPGAGNIYTKASDVLTADEMHLLWLKKSGGFDSAKIAEAKGVSQGIVHRTLAKAELKVRSAEHKIRQARTFSCSLLFDPFARANAIAKKARGVQTI